MTIPLPCKSFPGVALAPRKDFQIQGRKFRGEERVRDALFQINGILETPRRTRSRVKYKNNMLCQSAREPSFDLIKSARNSEARFQANQAM